MKKLKVFRSIRLQIPIMICISTLIPLLIFLHISYTSLNEISLESFGAVIQNDLYTKALSMDYILQEATQFAQSEGTDVDLIYKIRNYTYASSPELRQIARSQLTMDLNQRIVGNSIIQNIYLVVEDNDVVVSTLVGQKELSVDTGLGALLYDDFLSHKDLLAWSSITDETGTAHLLYHRPISDLALPDAALIFELNSDYLSELIEAKAFEEAEVLVCDYKGFVMMESDLQTVCGSYFSTSDNISDSDVLRNVTAVRSSNGSYTTHSPAGEVLVEYYSSTLTSWKYIEVVNLEKAFPTDYIPESNLVAALVIGVLASILGASIIFSIILVPMNRVISAMEKTCDGNFQKINDPIPSNELGTLIGGYNTMTQRLEELIENVYVQELSKREARLQLIQSQLDEHFLYNTLNTIYCVMKRGDTHLAADMVIMLTKFFRLNLSEGRQYMRLCEIEELIKCYLMIQKTRYGDRLHVSIDMDPELSQCYVVKFLFQPLVENAINHGLEQKADGGTVYIKFEKRGDYLYFETKDDGVGMSSERLAELRTTMAEYQHAIGKSFSLKTITEQMRLAYGAEHHLRIESTLGVGTKTSFLIPLKWEDPNGT